MRRRPNQSGQERLGHNVAINTTTAQQPTSERESKPGLTSLKMEGIEPDIALHQVLRPAPERSLQIIRQQGSSTRPARLWQIENQLIKGWWAAFLTHLRAHGRNRPLKSACPYVKETHLRFWSPGLGYPAGQKAGGSHVPAVSLHG